MTSGRSSSRIAFDQRLDAHFATLRSPSPREVLQRSASRWKFYAAVTGSAMAMATGVSASAIHNGVDDAAGEAVASAVAMGKQLASSRNVAFINAIKPAIGRAGIKTSQASQSQAPVISAGGIVPLFSTTSVIQAGEWISIYGSNLASGIALWNGDFPISLGGTSVTVNGKAAYLLFVSPGQINLQTPDDTATGTVSVVVTTGSGSAASTVSLSQFAPSFLLLDKRHVAGIILRKNGLGAYGGGTYDILGPTGNSLGYATVAARPGDNVVLFCIGFGPTTPFVPAGEPYSGVAPLNNKLSLYAGDVSVLTTFAGISSAGVYQINLRVPYGLGTGDISLLGMVGGLHTQAGVVISLDDPPIGTGTGTGGVPPVFSSQPIFVSSHPVFTSFPPGSGGASSAARRQAYEPRKLKFPPK